MHGQTDTEGRRQQYTPDRTDTSYYDGDEQEGECLSLPSDLEPPERSVPTNIQSTHLYVWAEGHEPREERRRKRNTKGTRRKEEEEGQKRRTVIFISSRSLYSHTHRTSRLLSEGRHKGSLRDLRKATATTSESQYRRARKRGSRDRETEGNSSSPLPPSRLSLPDGRSRF